MEVVSARSALLSNYEVLSLLRELEANQLAQTKIALRVKKEEDERMAAAALSKGKGKEKEVAPPSTVLQHPIEEVSENLRTVEFEAIQYLSADYQPTSRQSDAAIAKLVKKLAQYDLTKAEKLQIVNLAPTQAVELYVIVEEIEDRMGDHMDDVLQLVRESLTAIPTSTQGDDVKEQKTNATSTNGHLNDDEGWDDAEADMDDVEYDDTGEGAGVEGDLEADDD
ncbi:hypothetical protein SCHPADRAFT_225279 [Schizopora paradoxa]|uniref:DNA-directed RNA polymerase III subunit RPC9 n=1 Tax=Schizopora paradoxa TaxID=27342 RepID=A0A0H2S356_9AGAM|nr:hypothetical protein SCHPADRAFT_225279 [Schizopora paradoxa]